MGNNNANCILVTGATGQLGYDIVRELSGRGVSNIGVGSANLDITNADAVNSFFDNHKITHVIHCAAYTKVDLAEEEKDKNYNINVIGTKNLVLNCKRLDIPMMYFSTDYVFDGKGDMPYKEDDKTNPLCEYAKSKLYGELEVNKLDKHFILRISWVFGKNGNNFIKTMLRLSETKNELSIVSDQIGSPTYTFDLSKLVSDMICTDKFGIYHATNEGYVSWADFAREIFKLTNKNVKVNDITSEAYGAKAMRPKNSRLDKIKLLNNGFKLLPTWQDALKRYLLEINAI